MERSLLRSSLAALLVALAATPLAGQAPAGLAASALADTSFHWVRRTAPGFRVYFLADSYAARHQDSLLRRLPPALAHATSLIHAPPIAAPIDLFFIESRAQMTRLTGGPSNGFAQPSARTVVLVTHPAWRAFERHEIMHVIAGQAWGPAAAGMDWLVEGLAQAADGYCAARPNVVFAQSLAARHGWIPLQTVLTAFRAQPDLRAYLQAAAFTDHLLRSYGAAPLQQLWRGGASVGSRIAGRTLGEIEADWRARLRATATGIPEPAEVDRVEARGCG